MNNSIKSAQGFTLAELLIALAILGVIATFTIPKILTTQQNSKYNAMAKEVASSFAEHIGYTPNPTRSLQRPRLPIYPPT